MKIDWLVLFGQTFLFFFPAYIANLSPILFSKFRVLGRLFEMPLDAGKMVGKRRILGKNKTVGGFVFGVLGGIIGAMMIVVFQYLLNGVDFDSATLFSFLIFGFLSGLGALTGDLIKSFFKRRLNIAEGKPWWFFDQDDFVVGCWLFSGLFVPYSLTWHLFLIGLIITPPLHFLANLLAFKLKMKEVWW